MAAGVGGGVDEKNSSRAWKCGIHLRHRAVRNKNRNMNRAEGGGRGEELRDYVCEEKEAANHS